MNEVLLTGIQTPLKGIRRTAARRMVQAWQAPVFHLGIEVEMEAALAKGKSAPGVTVTDVLLSLAANTLASSPEINAHYSDEVITTYSEINIGIAVATEAGLMVPVIHNVQDLSLVEIGARRKEIVAKARNGELRMADIDGATFTISNLGMLGIDRFDAIINPPQVAILAVGSTRKIPVVRESGISIGQISAFTLTCDHRAIDGAMGAKFLSRLKALLEEETESASQ